MTAPQERNTIHRQGTLDHQPDVGRDPLRQRFAPDTQKPLAQIADPLWPLCPFLCSPLSAAACPWPGLGFLYAPSTRLQPSNRLRENYVTPGGRTQWEPNDDCFSPALDAISAPVV
ncbi:hypothetical protein CLIM01_07034 [Colletotrichum limetticola]|uniref:Uncharacterized protein n=1 Tax=Colletotrichum limetticola TaxID=1209924 RepID=A0ABQ9PVS5_9PEZI|nr:hypothetical protein CLIM01_07034 [Colletotrichum limetticola]